ncbi:DUF559 domain-containing protein [Intrasporangium calvum]|uniref:DUF559 domain-containing protein n=1 Tax=Intrasporangium calvum (strain ATCC 23552 / DSM 43043 / JCM 3097 / NBRC 12989 / NCIMB 10167 / NRRL B-3866 / 7 KIP) TaxID=710696 RepID=E6SAC0_INTC7|nr:DUF559 domain-containing protein [Intrasporangium calvum]ADU49368.1 hypothetical protein Intca_2869 [Intrasporangium calvum DSM 43043]
MQHPLASPTRATPRRGLTATDVVSAVQALGGTCSWRELRRAVPWRLIGPAVTSGLVVRSSHGVYTLPTTDEARVVAARMTGAVSHRSAALHWGWKVKASPDLPDVTVPTGRKVRPSVAGLSTVHRRDCADAELEDGWVTSRERTIIDCCRDLPFDEALSVFDSALRGGLRRSSVTAAAGSLGPRHRAKVMAVARAASGRADNPFESVLRAIALGVPDTTWEPQHRIRYDDFSAKVDVACEKLQIVLEADSFEFHGRRAALNRDCERYDELVARGWLVLRFSWEQVMFRPEWVAGVITRAVHLRRRPSADDAALQGRMTHLPAVEAVA